MIRNERTRRIVHYPESARGMNSWTQMLKDTHDPENEAWLKARKVQTKAAYELTRVKRRAPVIPVILPVLCAHCDPLKGVSGDPLNICRVCTTWCFPLGDPPQRTKLSDSW
jgi:hypothetical protein